MASAFDSFFEKLYKDNYASLIKYVYRLTYEKNFAEEIVQDAFTEAYKKIELLQRHVNPAGWLYITVKNITKAYLREAKAINRCLPLQEADYVAEAVVDEESDLLICLTSDEKNLLISFYINGYSISEIASEKEITVSACKMRIKRARDKIKEQCKI